MRSLFVAALIGIAFSAATAAPVPKEKTVEAKVLGTWKLVKTDAQLPQNQTFEINYMKDGVMAFVRTFKDKDMPKQVLKGKYKASEPDDKNKLGTIDWKVSDGEDERGEVSKIIKLTDTELVFEDPDGIKETFERVKEKKPKKKED